MSVKPVAIVVLIIGGLLLGSGLGGLVHDAVTRLAPPHQTASGEGMYGALAGLGFSLTIVAGWINRSGRD